ncbi:cell envelope integrity protein TolA [Tsukamurella sp. USMM236]|uniref:cell envelope integrity protein TolA n=1 Tax=Tsukamurella sp. USMM236 TaxID=3081301 RepID=UPI00301A431B
MGWFSWIRDAWDFFFALSASAWSAIAAWFAVGAAVFVGLKAAGYAKEQVRQIRQQITDAERDRIVQADKDRQASIERDRARTEQMAQAEADRAVREQAMITQAESAEAARQQQADDAKKLRELQARPNVVMFARPVEGNWQFLDIVIKNFGTTPAFDIRIELDSTPESAPDSPGEPIRPVAIPDFIPILAPGQEWRGLWDFAPHHIDAQGIKNVHEGTVRYTDISRSVHYETPVSLDFLMLNGAEFVSMNTIHDVAKTLEKRMKATNEALVQIGKIAAKFSSENTGIWVNLSEDPQQLQARRDAERMQDAADANDLARRFGINQTEVQPARGEPNPSAPADPAPAEPPQSEGE